jgi:hypothetical protein
MWVDYRLAPGWSDEWITGYVADRIAGTPGTENALARGWEALRTRTAVRPAGWGFNALVPQDADSTSWALRLALKVNAMDSPEAQRALGSLTQFKHHDGRFSTYGPTESIAAFIGADPSRTFAGWTAPHDCVTAAAAGVPALVSHETIRATQCVDGRWKSYWWCSDTFATSLAVEALSEGPAVQSAADWAIAHLTSPVLTAFETANLVLVSVTAGRTSDSVVTEAVKRLTATMRPDGSWNGGAYLRVPDPDDLTPDDRSEWIPGGHIEGAVVVDERRHFTTATVAHALMRAMDTGGQS